MLKLFMRMWTLIMGPGMYRSLLCIVLCLSTLSQSAAYCDSEMVSIDMSHLKGVLKKMCRSRIGRENKQSIRALLKEDLSNSDLQKVLGLVPLIRNYLSKRLNKPGKKASMVQLRALAYLSVMKNAMAFVGFDKSYYRSFTQQFSDEVDQLFEQLPQHYSALAIRSPNLDAFGKGSREVTEDQISACLDLELEKLNTLLDQLLSVESNVDVSDQAAEISCSKLDVISIDEQDAPGRFLATWDFGGKYSGSVGDSTEFMARGKAAAGAIEWALLLIEKRREKEGEAQGD